MHISIKLSYYNLINMHKYMAITTHKNSSLSSCMLFKQASNLSYNLETTENEN